MDNNDFGAAAGFAGMIMTIFWIFFGIWLISVIGLWKVYAKAGKPGWASLIPIYNAIVFIEITGKPLWWFFLLLIPCVNLIFAVWLVNIFSKSFGKGEGFTIGLLILPPLFYAILGFGNAVYVGPAAAEAKQFKQ